jgi:hypothetical protein
VVVSAGTVTGGITAGPAGGYLFYDKGSYSNGWRYLEAGAANLGANHQWSNPLLGSQNVTGAMSTAVGSGKANTDASLDEGSALNSVVTSIGCASLSNFYVSTQYGTNGSRGYNAGNWKGLVTNYYDSGTVTRAVRQF